MRSPHRNLDGNARSCAILPHDFDRKSHGGPGRCAVRQGQEDKGHREIRRKTLKFRSEPTAGKRYTPNVLVVLIRKFHLGSGFRSVYTLLNDREFLNTHCLRTNDVPIVWILEVGPKTRRIRATMKSYIVELNGSRMQPAKDSLMGSSGRAPQQGSPVSRSASDLRPIFFKFQPGGRHTSLFRKGFPTYA